MGCISTPVGMLPIEKIPKEFLDFLTETGVDINVYYEYSHGNCVTILGDDADAVRDGTGLVPWVPYPTYYYKLANQEKLSQDSNCFSMDAASALAVAILDPQPGEHVLDLCCAPGMKLSLIGRLVGLEGSVTGVDISKSRLSVCRSIVKAKKVGRCRLFCADGTLFDIPPLLVLDRESRGSHSHREKPFYQSTAFNRFPVKLSEEWYDKVLVDAQCTHDGSIKHIQKADEKTWSVLKDQLSLDALEKLYRLQLALLKNGFAKCRVGGYVVYSTCSFSRKQNEDIVELFLKEHEEKAKLVDIECKLFDTPQPFVRVDPRIHGAGFLFVAKIFKKCN